jgi:hypothetical protein
MARRPGPDLKVIAAAQAPVEPQPSCKLGEVGLSLWRDIISSYEFNDRGSYETLSQACAAADRAEELRAAIDRDGPVIRAKGVIRDHPLLKHEIAARSFVVRTLARLGLDLEPVRSGPGRPPSGSVGITWQELERIRGDQTP